MTLEYMLLLVSVFWPLPKKFTSKSQQSCLRQAAFTLLQGVSIQCFIQNTVDKMCQSNTTIISTKHIMWQQGYMFWLSLSHLQALMIQIHTKNVLCIVGSPMLTISVVNTEDENKLRWDGNEYKSTASMPKGSNSQLGISQLYAWNKPCL